MNTMLSATSAEKKMFRDSLFERILTLDATGVVELLEDVSSWPHDLSFRYCAPVGCTNNALICLHGCTPLQMACEMQRRYARAHLEREGGGHAAMEMYDRAPNGVLWSRVPSGVLPLQVGEARTDVVVYDVDMVSALMPWAWPSKSSERLTSYGVSGGLDLHIWIDRPSYCHVTTDPVGWLVLQRDMPKLQTLKRMGGVAIRCEHVNLAILDMTPAAVLRLLLDAITRTDVDRDDDTDINAATDGGTLLHAVARCKDHCDAWRIDTANILIEYGCDPTIKDREGRLASDIAQGAFAEHLNWMPHTNNKYARLCVDTQVGRSSTQ